MTASRIGGTAEWALPRTGSRAGAMAVIDRALSIMLFHKRNIISCLAVMMPHARRAHGAAGSGRAPEDRFRWNPQPEQHANTQVPARHRLAMRGKRPAVAARSESFAGDAVTALETERPPGATIGARG